MLIPPNEVYIRVYNVEIVTITKWQSTVMLLISSTSSMIMKDVGALTAYSWNMFHRFFFRDLQLIQVHIRIRGEGYEKIFSMPTQLRKLITTGVFEKVKDDGMNPVIKYKGKKKHQTIKDREYHTFEIVNILTKDGDKVNKQTTTP